MNGILTGQEAIWSFLKACDGPRIVGVTGRVGRKTYQWGPCLEKDFLDELDGTEFVQWDGKSLTIVRQGDMSITVELDPKENLADDFEAA